MRGTCPGVVVISIEILLEKTDTAFSSKSQLLIAPLLGLVHPTLSDWTPSGINQYRSCV